MNLKGFNTMTVCVTEYLGVNVFQDQQQITPIKDVKSTKPLKQCPFKYGHCDKLSKGYQPVCSVRKADGRHWITCEHRLCATVKSQKNIHTNETVSDAPLVEHQKNLLQKIALEVYGEDVKFSDIGIRREEPVPVEGGNTYKADYVMVDHNNPTGINFILEMQGGGETTNTGKITAHIEQWAKSPKPTNKMLRNPVASAGTLETNAWRRQQEQFLVKGNVVTQTGGRIVFVVGGLIFDYIYERISRSNLRDLKGLGWSLALISIKDEVSDDERGLNFTVDKERIIYTNYNTFVRTLTDQGAPRPELFQGDFMSIV